jgi:N4-gp56 family major capsid protein
MATTVFGVNDPLAVKLWSKRLIREALKATFIFQFAEESDDAMVQIREETEKSAGDRITIGLRMQLTGDGTLGDGTLEGNEEALVTFSDNLFIDQLRHAVRSGGKMSEQRVPFSVREEGLAGLRDWWAGRLDQAMANQLAGNTLVTDVRYTGNQAAVGPSSNNLIIQGGYANEQSITSTDVFNLNLIDRASARAKTLTPVIRPLRLGREPVYVAFLHNYQVYSLRTATAVGQWLDIQKAAMTGGEIDDNPLLTGALGKYNNVILHEWSRLPNAISSASGLAVANTKRALFAGAQAGAFALGMGHEIDRPAWVEQLFDYGNQLGVSAGLIYGLKKLVYNAQDFGTIVLSSYAAQP